MAPSASISASTGKDIALFFKANTADASLVILSDYLGFVTDLYY